MRRATSRPLLSASQTFSPLTGKSTLCTREAFGRSMTAPTNAPHLFVGEAFRLPQAGRVTRPLRGQRTKGLSLRGPSGRGNLPVQLCGYGSTDVEATPYREIPTDGNAVLGMTYFLPSCANLGISRPLRGQRTKVVSLRGAKRRGARAHSARKCPWGAISRYNFTAT